MSPERKLAELVAHPWTEYRQGNEAYDAARCQLEYAMRVNQLAAICDMHRRTPVTKELMDLNGFELCKHSSYCWTYKLNSDYCLWYHNTDAPLLLYSCEIANESATLFSVNSVSELENLLDLLGIDKEIKLPQPC